MRPQEFMATRAIGMAALALVMAGATARADDGKTSINREVKSDGSSSVNVSSTPGWLDGASYGVDMSLAAQPSTTVQPAKPLPWTQPDSSSAAAWAKVNVPTNTDVVPWSQTTVEMRVDPTQNQGKVGTTFSRDMKVTDHMTASVNDSYSMVRNSDNASVVETGKSLSLKLDDFGTTFSVGATNTVGDKAWLPSASAEQKLIGPLSVTTSVADTGSEINKSITAGFKSKW